MFSPQDLKKDNIVELDLSPFSKDDIEKIKGSEAANLLNQVKADLAARH